MGLYCCDAMGFTVAGDVVSTFGFLGFVSEAFGVLRRLLDSLFLRSDADWLAAVSAEVDTFPPVDPERLGLLDEYSP